MPYLSIREASEDIRSWMTTPTELVEEALERIELLDGEIKAFITVLREQALAEAEQRTGFYRSPLHGIPVDIA
jgi:aspartyl-tRNA(Asn)/glutamyl-tRNA(Gln) amidotransferase subunit A